MGQSINSLKYFYLETVDLTIIVSYLRGGKDLSQSPSRFHANKKNNF